MVSRCFQSIFRSIHCWMAFRGNSCPSLQRHLPVDGWMASARFCQSKWLNGCDSFEQSWTSLYNLNQPLLLLWTKFQHLSDIVLISFLFLDCFNMFHTPLIFWMIGMGWTREGKIRTLCASHFDSKEEQSVQLHRGGTGNHCKRVRKSGNSVLWSGGKVVSDAMCCAKVWVCLKMLAKPHCTQWFCWSLSLWKMAISLGRLTQHFQTNPYVQKIAARSGAEDVLSVEINYCNRSAACPAFNRVWGRNWPVCCRSYPTFSATARGIDKAH